VQSIAVKIKSFILKALDQRVQMMM
jgi:hypothetical protein